MRIKTVKLRCSLQLWAVHAFIAAFQNFQVCSKELERQTDKYTHHRCQVWHLPTFTLLSQPPLISNPERGAPFQPAKACFSCHCTLSGVTNHHQSNRVGLRHQGLGLGERWWLWWRFLLSLSFSLSPPVFLPSSSSPPPPPSFVYFQSSVLPASAILTGAIFFFFF